MSLQLPDDFTRMMEDPSVPFHVHEVQPTRVKVQMILGALLLVFGIILSVLFLIFVLGHQARGTTIKLFILLVGMAVVGGGAVVQAITSRGRHVIVVPQLGLVSVRGHQIQPYRWHDVTELRLVSHYTRHPFRIVRDEGGNIRSAYLEIGTGSWPFKQYTIKLKNGAGEELTLNTLLSDFPQLAQTAQEAIFSHLWPRVKTAFEHGIQVKFGDIVLDQQGIHHGKKTLAWNDLKEAQINESGLYLTKKGKLLGWFQTGSLDQIANLHVCMALIDHARATLPQPEHEKPET